MKEIIFLWARQYTELTITSMLIVWLPLFLVLLGFTEFMKKNSGLIATQIIDMVEAAGHEPTLRFCTAVVVFLFLIMIICGLIPGINWLAVMFVFLINTSNLYDR